MSTGWQADGGPHLHLRTGLRWVGIALALVAAATVIAAAMSALNAAAGISLVYLVFVLLAATQAGTMCGIAAALLSFLAYNFFFIEPLYTFDVTSPQEVLALGIFLLVAIFTGGLAGRMRDQTAAARRYAESLQSLHDLAAEFAGSSDLKRVCEATATKCAEVIGGTCVVLLKEDDELSVSAAAPAFTPLEADDWRAAQRAFARGENVPPPAAGWPGARFEFRPLGATRGSAGVIGLRAGGGDSAPFRAELEPVIGALVRTAGMAIERTRLADENDAARLAVEEERLRSALLSSISHDLRTPLASIVGASSSLRQLGPQMSEEARQDLVATIEEEAARLSQFVANLLEMTKLESGPIDLRADWIDLADPVRAALGRARHLFPGQAFELRIENDVPLIRGEAAALEQVAFNLLDNAVKHGRGGQIVVSLARSGRGAVLTVTDDGAGIARAEIDRIFDKFYRIRKDDRGAPGTGLGLTICRAIVSALGGTIRAESPVRDGRGTRLVVELPGSDNSLTPAGSAP